MSEKSILEQALLQVQTLEVAVKPNAKGILASTMKEELSDLLKESLEEEETVDTDEKSKDPMDEQPNPEEEEDDMSDDEATADDAEADDAENDTDLDNQEPTKGIDSLDSGDEMSHDEPDADNAGGPSDFDADNEDDDMGSEDDDVMDMTGASDDEVLKVFKAMKPEDGIVVKKDGNKLELETGDGEYIINLGDDDDSDSEDLDMDSDSDDSDMGSEMEEETLYEIELDEDGINETALKGLGKPKKVEPKEEALKGLKNPKKVEPKEEALAGLKNPKKVEPKEEALPGLKNPKKVEPKEEALKGLKNPKKVEPKEEVDATEEEVDEAARTFGADVRNPANQGKKYKACRHEMNEEVENLKKQNAEYKKALILFKEKLNEVAVFNANLAYATRLFTEHSTTKQEKLEILKRFDTINSLNEAKSLFTQIKNELGSKTTVTESVVEKITNTPSTSSSTEMLSESKAYENPQFSRIKEMMRKIK
jgi:hypothetical protein